MKNINDGDTSTVSEEHLQMLDVSPGMSSVYKTKWQKFEDFFWYNSHKQFEDQAKQTGMITNPKIIYYIRLTMAATLVFDWILLLGFNVPPKMWYTVMKFFTQWGVFLTTLCTISSVMVETSSDGYKFNQYQKYNFFKAWKWFTFLFQLSFIMELIITPFFWIMLWDAEVKKREGKALPILGLVLDHALPMVCLLIEYFLCSAMPFTKRHFIGIVIICGTYLIMNLSITLITGKPIYAPMTWTDPMGIIVPMCVIVLAIGLLFLMECVTRKKLAL